MTEEEIRFFIDGYTNKKIPDYQASALLMAMFLNDLTPDEIAALTAAMIDSEKQSIYPPSRALKSISTRQEEWEIRSA